MVHAYLMYGFPTQTAQETVDSLEMVRQLFGHGVLQSGFWHQFAMTAHAPVGLTPEDFGVAEVGPVFEGFADNDRFHEDPSGAEHERFGPGLSKALYNYMHGHGLDFPLSDWFDFKVPRTRVSPEFIYDALESEEDEVAIKPSTKVVYIGHPFRLRTRALAKGRRQQVYRAQLGSGQVELPASRELQAFVEQVLPLCAPGAGKKSLSWSSFQASCLAAGIQDFDAFTESEVWMGLLEAGLLLL
ncbi:hypothetical protein [Nitritalea halalkaliphila]|uniref:hypothetical protein n=1 Tax=Nitritalea halalkaliphila TaxID=590849 RepID=UPI002934A5EC|nr:hypothetical protein [Nitritalea halalkaliphila]